MYYGRCEETHSTAGTIASTTPLGGGVWKCSQRWHLPFIINLKHCLCCSPQQSQSVLQCLAGWDYFGVQSCMFCFSRIFRCPSRPLKTTSPSNYHLLNPSKTALWSDPLLTDPVGNCISFWVHVTLCCSCGGHRLLLPFTALVWGWNEKSPL